MFKKIIITSIFIIILGAAAFITPKVLDWSDYQTKVATYFKEKTGKNITIAGTTEFTIFPSPRLVVRKATVMNNDGFSQPVMMEIPAIEISISPMSLISDDMIINDISIISPTINLERNQSGKGNWDLSILNQTKKTDVFDADITTSTTVETPLKQAKISIKNGKINFIDKAQAVLTYDKINASINAVKSNGPYKIEGGFNFNNYFYSTAINVNEVFNNIDTSLKIDLTQQETQTKASFSGFVGYIFSDTTFNGSGIVEANNAKAIYQLMTKSTNDSEVTNSMALTFDIEKNATKLNIANLIFRYGENTGTINLDTELEKSKATKIKGNIAISKLFTNDIHHFISKENITSIIDTPEVDITFIADLIDYKNQKFTNNTATFTGDAYTLNVDNINTVILDNTNIKGKLVFDKKKNNHITGSATLNSSNLPRIIEWHTEKDLNLAPNSFKSVTISSDISGFLNNINFNGAKIKLDNIVSTMNVGIDTQNERPIISLDGDVTAFNMNSYVDQLIKTSPLTTKQEKLVYIINHLNLFPEVDKKLKLNLDFINYKGFPFTKANLEMTTSGNNISIQNISGNFGGIDTKIIGNIETGSANPTFKNFTIDVFAKNPSYTKIDSLISFLDINQPFSHKEANDLKITAILNGNFNNITIDGQIKTNLSSFAFAGDIDTTKDVINGKFDIRLTNLKQALKSLGIEYQSTRPFGIAKATGTINKLGKEISLKGIELSVGSETVSGDLTYKKEEQKKTLKGRFKTSFFSLDNYLPAANINLWSGSDKKLQPQWNKNPIEFSKLDNFDINIGLDFQQLTFQDLTLQQGTTFFTTKNKKVTLDVPNAMFNGGKFQLKSNIDYTNEVITSDFKGKITDSYINKAVFATESMDITKGILSAEYDFKSTGSSIDQIINKLNGSAKFTIKDAMIKGAGLNNLATLFARLYSQAEPITEKELQKQIKYFTEKRITSTPEIDGTVSVANSVINIETQPFSVETNAVSSFSSSIGIADWSISSKWDLNVDKVQDLGVTILTTGSIEKPTREVASDKVMTLLKTKISQNAKQATDEKNKIASFFASTLKQIQTILPKIRNYERQSKQLATLDPALQEYHTDVTDNMKIMGKEIHTIKKLYEKPTKTVADIEPAQKSLDLMNASFKTIETTYLQALHKLATDKITPIAKQIFTAEEMAKSFVKNDPDKSKIYEEIADKAKTTRDSLKLIDNTKTLQDVQAIETTISELWDRVNYLVTYMKDTAPGQISGSSDHSNDKSRPSKIPSISSRMKLSDV